mmetsp:Transcript_3534/g.7430  ORF Transcript_3534/g.7430 Transcript_3534/m.7430 type:complete len:732 (-) Transcript_3534:2939-5134(-)
MTDESNKKRNAASESELPMREATKSVLFAKIDVDSDEMPTLKKGVRSVKARSHGGRRKKQIADEFPPDIVQTVRLALFQQTETLQCGANLVRNLTAQNLIPPESIARELMDVIKSFHYKNPLRTTFAGLYASALVSASARLVRRNGSAIFGPSSWDDVEVLLSQSTERAVASAGIRLTHELQAAACGAKLLSLLLKTELLDFNLSSTNYDFNSESLRAKPTVAVLKKQGLSNVLKTATRHATKCLVRHAKYLLDSDIDMPPSSHPNHVPCCASEAKTCLDNLGSVICYTAWLLCAKEKVSIDHLSSAIVIRDAFLSELSLCDDTLPKATSKKKKMFITKLKLRFLLSLLEEFAFPLQDMVASLIELGVELDSFGEEDAKQEGDYVPDVVNVDCGSANQLVRKSSVPILVQRQNELLEAYELENKDSSLFWVEFVSDGKCLPVSSDRIFRGRKRKPRPSKRPTYEKDPQLLSRGKSSRFLIGNKITPLDTGIILEDLCQMETFDKACKRFHVKSFISRNHVEVAGCNNSSESERESINCAIASVPTPTHRDDVQSSEFDIPGQGKLTHDEAIAAATCEAPATDTSQEATQEQLTPHQNPQLQQNYLPRKIEGESWQWCRYCQQSFYIAADGLSRHEVACPVKIQMQQSFQQEPHNELHHNQQEGQFQLQGQQNFVSYLPTPFTFAPTLRSKKFPALLHEMLSSEECSHIISWMVSQYVPMSTFELIPPVQSY